MGKGSEALEDLTAQVLTAEEVDARRAIAESGGDVEATADGRLVRPVPESPGEAQEVVRVPSATWD
jgi:hypothetical protein